MAAFDTAQTIMEQYPMFAFLLNDPQVGPLLTAAVNPSQPFSQQRFQAQLMQTPWYRSRSAAQRQWEILANSDPAEAERRRNEYKYQVADVINKTGFHISGPEWDYITEANLSRGVEVGSPEFNWGLRTFMQSQMGTGVNRLVLGGIQGAANNIADMAKGDYFVHLPDTEIYRTAIDQQLGYLDDAAIKYKLQEYASSMYPHLRPQLDQGATMRDLFSGHIQTLGEEWEQDPGSIDVYSPVMQQIIGRRDPQTGEMRAASLYEAKVLARQDDQFYRTSRWRQMDSAMTNTLLQAFGKRAA